MKKPDPVVILAHGLYYEDTPRYHASGTYGGRTRCGRRFGATGAAYTWITRERALAAGAVACGRCFR